MSANTNAVGQSDATQGWWLPAWTLAVREVVRFLRQRSRVMGAIGQPIIFWILFGAGLAGSFQLGESPSSAMSFQEYFLPGIAVLIVLFTSIFSSISVIQDRNEGFLQGVLVAPVPRASIVLGKVLGGTFLALLQAFLFLIIAPLLHFVGLAPAMSLNISPLHVAGAVFFLAMISLGLTALGYLFAWKIDSVQGYHGVMSVVLLPMWLLSGAFFPGTGSAWMKWIIALNPLTYGVAGLRACLSSGGATSLTLPPIWLSLLVTVGFAAVCLLLDIWFTRRDPAVT
ncbi:ABC transporter permease [Planctomicrobium sp. SH664]|uniref:ABC transporter permease n=1 Tax=Planctomicrobium sp. SH664 TaxID=3448125 RepID=UPI003F5C79E1